MKSTFTPSKDDALMRDALDPEFAAWNLHHPLVVGRFLTASSLVMLPYWEARFPQDERIPSLVAAMRAWAIEPVQDHQDAVADKVERVGFVKRRDFFRRLPHEPEPVRSDCPADFAGDSIISAGFAIAHPEGEDFYRIGKDAVRQAVEAIARVLVERQLDDEGVDFASLARAKLDDDVWKILIPLLMTAHGF